MTARSDALSCLLLASALAPAQASPMARAGRAGVAPNQSAAERPRLELDCYFTGTLDEDFTYSDGRREKRVWTIRKLGAGRYLGTAGDVVGEPQGSAAGNAPNWRYVLDLKVGEKNYHVDFDDWMVQIDEDVMLNRAVMSKFGFRLGEVTLAFRKRK